MAAINVPPLFEPILLVGGVVHEQFVQLLPLSAFELTHQLFGGIVLVLGDVWPDRVQVLVQRVRQRRHRQRRKLVVVTERRLLVANVQIVDGRLVQADSHVAGGNSTDEVRRQLRKLVEDDEERTLELGFVDCLR